MTTWYEVYTTGEVVPKSGPCFAAISKKSNTQQHFPKIYENLKYILFNHSYTINPFILKHFIPWDKGTQDVSILDSRNNNAYEVFLALMWRRQFSRKGFQYFNEIYSVLMHLVVDKGGHGDTKEVRAYAAVFADALCDIFRFKESPTFTGKLTVVSTHSQESHFSTYQTRIYTIVKMAMNMLDWKQITAAAPPHYIDVDTIEFYPLITGTNTKIKAHNGAAGVQAEASIGQIRSWDDAFRYFDAGLQLLPKTGEIK